MAVFYRWLDFFAKTYRETECEVLSDTGRTAKIRLKGFGRNGMPPGTVMRCHLKSLVGYPPPAPPAPDNSPDWQKYTYFE